MEPAANPRAFSMGRLLPFVRPLLHSRRQAALFHRSHAWRPLRLRGYPSNRFHDTAALLYSAEYRLMPDWQPFAKIDLLNPLGIRWWQIVGLAEAGRVAPSWNIDTLHTDMKYDFGIGLRGIFHASIGRIDFVFSEEGFVFAAMVGQSF